MCQIGEVPNYFRIGKFVGHSMGRARLLESPAPTLRRFVPKYYKIGLLGLDALCFTVPCILLSNLLSNTGALVPSNPIRKHLSGV